jgi:hypothetical protein
MGQPAKEAQRPSRLGFVQPRRVNEGMARQKARSYQFLSIKPAASQIAISIRCQSNGAEPLFWPWGANQRLSGDDGTDVYE